MINNLTHSQLHELITTVFNPRSTDRHLVLMVDVPNNIISDNKNWLDRRTLALQWKDMLINEQGNLNFEQISFVGYDNVRNNNADLPGTMYSWPKNKPPADISDLRNSGESWKWLEICERARIIFALTEFSATAPLKNLAKQFGFRAASMPGFNRKMLPALGLNYEEIAQRVLSVKNRLDNTVGIDIQFTAEEQHFELFVDTRFRQGHASTGLIREPGTAWNLPSGEAFIVPYEGELEQASQTRGRLPVQFGDEIVVYEVKENRATEIISKGKFSDQESQTLRRDPAYGNIAEIGFGVLHPFGIKPIGEILLDEKLGLHIAFGRSDHFGGAISPRDFANSEHVVHIDRIYIKEVQNKVTVNSVDFLYSLENKERIIENGNYTI